MTPEYALGLFFIFLVSVIWAAASILVQFLYQSLHFNSPLLLTYIGSSLFVLLIPMRLIWERHLRYINRLIRCLERCLHVDIGSENISTLAQPIIIPWDTCTRNPISSYFSELEQIEMNVETLNVIEEEVLSPQGSQQSYQNLLQGQDEIPEIMPSGDVSASTDSCNDDDDYLPSPFLLSHKEHMYMALRIAPLWFVSNYFYNLSLIFTSITSSTVLSSTGSVFTFIFAVCWGEEAFTRWKIFGVLLAFSGSVITSLHDASSSNDSDENDGMSGKEIWGDMAGVISAVGYGGYCVMIRVLCPKDENQMSMQLLLGYIGFFNMVVFGPIAVWKTLTINDDAASSSELSYPSRGISETSYSPNLLDDLPPQHLTWFIFGCLVVKGLFDNVISDYLWARAIILTSATVATVGLGLTVPLALLSDVFIMKREDVLSQEGIWGAVMVVAGFVSVNVGEV